MDTPYPNFQRRLVASTRRYGLGEGGKDESTAIYEVLAHVDEITPLLVDVVQVYERGLKKYQDSAFNEAVELLSRGAAYSA